MGIGRTRRRELNEGTGGPKPDAEAGGGNGSGTKGRVRLEGRTTTRRRVEEYGRGRYDWTLTAADGWAQLDTGQDAPWYGAWAHAGSRTVVVYAEGDETKTVCRDGEAFADEVRRFAAFHGTDWRGVDTGMNEETRRRFQELGLGALLHGGRNGGRT